MLYKKLANSGLQSSFVLKKQELLMDTSYTETNIYTGS